MSDLAVIPSPVSTTAQNRVLAVKIDLDWKTEASKKLYNRLRDLSWQAAHYRNSRIRALWAEARGFRLEPGGDKHGITKQVRKGEKGELSGAAYSAAEREVDASWQRDRSKILAGQPLPEWSTASALSIRGHKHKNESGVRLEREAGQYVAYISAQSQDSEGGCWLRLPIAKHTARDEHQGGILSDMVAWKVPIAKATLQIKRNGIVLRLTYAVDVYLPSFGDRVATLGPVRSDGRLLLRTETQTRDYTSKLARVREIKDEWDGIRRRAIAQIGWRHGHARLKRIALSRIGIDDWMHTYIHEWTREAVNWAKSQGIGKILVTGIDTGDWPAYKFVQMLTYKAADLGMVLSADADIADQSTERAAKATLAKGRKNIKRRNEAVRELAHQLDKAVGN